MINYIHIYIYIYIYYGKIVHYIFINYLHAYMYLYSGRTKELTRAVRIKTRHDVCDYPKDDLCEHPKDGSLAVGTRTPERCSQPSPHALMRKE